MGAPQLAFVGQIAPDAPALGTSAGEQTQAALGRLADTLAERGLGLEDLLRLRLFVADLDARAAIEETLQTHLGSERPAVSVVELPAGSLPPRVAVSLDAVAAPGSRESRRLSPGSVRLGPWVLLGALAAIEPGALFKRMEERLREQGAELRDVLRLGSWLTFPLRDYGPFGAARRELVASAGLLPASAGVQVGRVGLAGERLACEALAYAPEVRTERSREGRAEDRREDRAGHQPEARAGARSRLADFYVNVRSEGGYVFTSGEVPEGRGSVREQASEVYERLRSHLAAHDASPADVIQQTVFVRRAGEGDVIAEATREFCGADTPIPPTTLLTVADIGFHPGCDVEIELVAATDGWCANAR
jgi:enamine deaminase RidA (YjgF/YER057c/UK114 family)